jgi:16S rRNA (guanine527-N7)-methyltransferase
VALLDGLDHDTLQVKDPFLRPGRDALDVILKRCGVGLSRQQVDLLWDYHGLLRAANVRLNLTRIHNFENMVLKHYVDSLLILRFTDLPSPLIDMGSGPGLPGIPLKIARPETRMILAEPRGARAEFLREVCDALKLQDIDVYAHKLGPDFPHQVSGVISRAVGSIPETLERVAASLSPGGRMLFMKGTECDEEIAEAETRLTALFRLSASHAYTIPGTTHHRRLVVYERLEGKAPLKPRRPETEHAFSGLEREISSETNATFRELRELLSGRGIRKRGEALIAGPRIVAEVLERYPERVLAWITGGDGPPPSAEHVTWLRLSTPLFQILDVAGTGTPLLLVTCPPLPDWSDDEPWPEGCTLFVPFQDPENVGAVIRSAAAFGASRLVLLKEAAHPFHPRSARAAGTALFQIPLFRGPSIHEVRSAHVPLIALDASGSDLGTTPFPIRFGLVVGVEGPGLPQHLRQGDRRQIPIAHEVESLNAATAAAIALYAWSRQAGSGTSAAG